jgi:tripartite-type tricarboxylate transporter receptor subunit TctC
LVAAWCAPGVRVKLHKELFMPVKRILLATAALILAGSATAQQIYPSRPIRCISPYAPGGGNDTMARLIGQRLTERLGQQVIVDNRPGANTMIGTDIVAKARSDGHTILFSGIGTFIVNALLTRTPYDIIKDFAPVAPMAKTEMIMVLNSSVRANDLQALIALAKAKPGALNYATSSSGGTGHLAGELFKMEAGVDIVHVPYKGTSQALNDVVAGQVQMSIQSIVSTIPHIRSGRIKGIAVSGDSRFPALPQVPTFAESGLPAVEAKVVYGILAPAGTPKEIVEKLAAEIAAIQRTAEFKEKLAAQGVEAFILGPEQFAATIKSDMANYARIIKTANIKLEH